MYTRNQTRVISIGDVKIGGGNPVAIQSMTNTKTEDVEADGQTDSCIWRRLDVRSFAVLFQQWKLQKH